jgi:Protein of unknown function (DUF3429)
VRVTAKSAAWFLSVAGLIPFVGLAAVVVLLPNRADFAFRALLAYGMVILSFVGAIHWGAVLKQGHSNNQLYSVGGLVWGVIPSLWAWVTGAFDPHLQALWLVCGLLIALGVDMIAYRRYGIAPWALKIRWAATTGACASLVTVALSYIPPA